MIPGMSAMSHDDHRCREHPCKYIQKAACLLRRSQRAGGIMGRVRDALQQSSDSRSGYLQFGEGEHLFAEVFQRGADMINVRPVYD